MPDKYLVSHISTFLYPCHFGIFANEFSIIILHNTKSGRKMLKSNLLATKYLSKDVEKNNRRRKLSTSATIYLINHIIKSGFNLSNNSHNIIIHHKYH